MCRTYNKLLSTDEWSAPLATYATRPDPLSCHCFVKFDTSRAILFGGRYKDGARNDTWIFDLEERVCCCCVISFLRRNFSCMYMGICVHLA